MFNVSKFWVFTRKSVCKSGYCKFIVIGEAAFVEYFGLYSGNLDHDEKQKHTMKNKTKNVGEEITNRWRRYRCLFTIILISTCFGHHYAHRQENRLYKTVCDVCLDVLAAVVWSQDTISAIVPAPHYRNQHIQVNTTRGFIQSVLLTMGITMPETCWDLTNCE